MGEVHRDAAPVVKITEGAALLPKRKTEGSLMWQVLAALLWGLVVLGSFVSVGRLLARGLEPSLLDRVPLTAGLGMAGMLFLGGILTLAHLATKGALLALIVGVIALEGLVSLKFRRVPAPGMPAEGESHTSGRSTAVVAIGLLVVATTMRYVLSLGHPIHPYDDQPFYLAEIAELLQTGSSGVEPYNFRQMGILPGSCFLSAMGCCVAPPEYAYLIDPGICWIVFAGLVYTFLRHDLRLSVPLASLLSTMSLLVRVPMSTLGGELNGPVLFVTAVRLMYTGMTDSSALPFGRLVLIALVLSSLSVLKPTFLVYACLFLAFWSLLTLWHEGIAAAAGQTFTLASLIGLFMLPWMIQQYRSSGTLLYPILGKGYLFANHGFPLEIHGDSLGYRLRYLTNYATKYGYTLAPALTLIAVGSLFVQSPGKRTRAFLAASLSVVLGSYLVCFILNGQIERYTLHMMYVSCLLPGLFGLAVATGGDRIGLVLGCSLMMFIGSQWPPNALSSAGALRARARGEKIPDPAYAATIERAQSLTKPGERILVSVVSPYLFDFRRNPIWNFDILGMTSPPPGLPLTRDWKKLEEVLDGKSENLPPPGPVADFRDSLRRSGVDYLFFQRYPISMQYGDGDMLPGPFLDRLCNAVGRLTKESLMNLIQDRRVVFDDGNMILLDLRQGHVPAAAPNG
jgi:hypothetical protein